MTAVDVSHQPVRPAWTCGRCGQPWPCSPARIELGEKYAADRPALATHLGSLLVDASREIGTAGASPRELYERFVSWTR
ncbi:MAG TPA: hypothetical protein VGD43_09785 [Micromonospora sp.]